MTTPDDENPEKNWKISGKTPEQQAEERRKELLEKFDRTLDQTMGLIYENPERYLPPYAGGQKPRETPAPDRVTSPERQDPELPPKERPPVIPMFPKEKPPERGPDLPPAAKMTPEQLVQKQKEIEQLKAEVREMEQALGITLEGPGHHLTGKGHPQSKPPERILSEPEREARAQEEARREAEKTQEKPPERDLPIPPAHDSPERREAIKAHLTTLGVDPNLQAIRMLFEVGNAEPPHKAAERGPKDASPRERRDRDAPGQGQERTR